MRLPKGARGYPVKLPYTTTQAVAEGVEVPAGLERLESWSSEERVTARTLYLDLVVLMYIMDA